MKSFALDAYFERIDYRGERAPTAETLRALHRAHVLHIPFENLDVILGRGISLDLDDLQKKIVAARRGGYCFEQNALFAAALEALDFQVTRLAARVRLGSQQVRPRTHMSLLVEADGERWLADVGFGAWGLMEAIPLVADREVHQGPWRFHLRREGEEWILVAPQCPTGADQFAFTLEPQLPVDHELPNHYCATHRQSSFVRTLTVQRPTEDRRHILRGNEWTTASATETRTEKIESEEALHTLLRERFDLVLPEGTRLPLRAPV